MKKHDRKWYKKKAIETAKKIRRTQEGKCERCGKSGIKLDGSHILSVGYAQTAADLDNIQCLCSSCHTTHRDSWHKNPKRAKEWIDDYAPGLYESLERRAFQTWPKVDWESKYKELKEIMDKLEE